MAPLISYPFSIMVSAAIAAAAGACFPLSMDGRGRHHSRHWRQWQPNQIRSSGKKNWRMALGALTKTLYCSGCSRVQRWPCMYQFAKKKEWQKRSHKLQPRISVSAVRYDPLFGWAFDVICSDLFMSLSCHRQGEVRNQRVFSASYINKTLV